MPTRRKFALITAIASLTLAAAGLIRAQDSAIAAPAVSTAPSSTGPATSTAPATSAAPLPFNAPPGAVVTNEGWHAARQPIPAGPALPDKVTKAFVIPIREEISPKTFESLRRKASQVRAQGGQLVIFDMDTYGGRVDAAMDITRFIKTEFPGIRTVCLIRTRAISAGAMIAVSANEIVMTPVGILGDAQPIAATELAGGDREKVETVLKNEFKESARRNGYDPILSQSMVNASLEVWLVRHKDTMELRNVLADVFRSQVENPPASKAIAGASENPDAQWRYLRTIVPQGRVLTMSAGQAQDQGFAKHVVECPSDAPYRDILSKYSVTTPPVVLGAPSSTGPATSTAPAASAAPLPFNAPPGAVVTNEGWHASRQPIPAGPALPDKVTKAFVIPIREEISPKTFESLRRKASQVRAQGGQLVIFDMDTYGGRVDAAMDITRFIKTEFPGIRTVCLIRTRAISAGAMIAVSANEIVMTPVGTFGDCAPITMGGTIQGVEREKIETVIRNEFKESARRGGYDPALLQAMVSASLEVWLVRHRETMELQYVLAEEFRNQVENPPLTVTGVIEKIKDVVAGRNPDAKWTYLRTIVPQDRILTLDTVEAQKYGFVKHVVDTPAGDPYREILARYNVVGSATVLEDTWSEKMVEFLTNPMITGILMLIAFIAVYAELHTPGIGVAALVALVCFGLVFGSRFLVGMAQWWEIAAFVIGIILIFVEVFVIPGFGLAGITGIALCILAVGAMLVANAPDELPVPQTTFDWEMFTKGSLAVTLALVGAIIGGIILSRFLPKTPIARRLVLGPVVTGPDAALTPDSPLLRIQAGDVGIVISMCRPVGKVRFGDILVDASSQGQIIEMGEPVRVLRREGNHVVVERTST